MNQISIISPIYNSFNDELSALKFLELSNSLKDYYKEHIIINDGSTDNTHNNILKFLNNDKIKYINSDENRGILARLTELFALCNTKYAVGLSHDDILLANFLKDANYIIQKYADLGLIFSDMYSIDCNGRFDCHFKPNKLKEGYINPDEYMDQYILKNSLFHSVSGATIINKQEFMKYKYDHTLSSFADTFNQWLIGLSKGAYYSNQIGFIWRRNPSSFSQTEDKDYKTRKNILFESIYNSCLENKISRKNMSKIVNKYL